MGHHRYSEAAKRGRQEIGWLRRNAVALTALFVALGGTGYAAANAINGDAIKDATIAGKKLKKNTLGGREVRESKLRKVPRAALADSARPAGQAGGDLVGTYPSPRLAKAGAPIDVAANPNQATDPCFAAPAQTLVLCGTSTQRWTNGGFGLPGLQVWKDRLGQVHIRGSATITTGNSASLALFRLPANLRPKRGLGFPVVTGDPAGGDPGGSALLFIYPAGGSDGFVQIFQPSQGAQHVVHLGEIVFRADA